MFRLSRASLYSLAFGLSVCLLAVSSPASAVDPTIASAVEQSASLSATEKLQFVQRAVDGTTQWISGLEGEKEKALKDRQMSDEERKSVVSCYDAVLTPLREMLESMRRSSNEMQTAMAESNDVHADLDYKRVAVVYKLAGEKQAESMACAAGTSKKSGDALVSMDEGAQSSTGVIDEIVVDPNLDPSAGG
jgi:hypothetical protein